MNALRRRIPVHWLRFALALGLTLAMYTWYGANMARWPDSPDFGWRTMYDSGPNIVAEVFDAGRAAGLRAGDAIQAINGRPYGTFEELFFGRFRDANPGSANRYVVVRDGKSIEITIPTGRLGVQAIMRRSGPLFTIGFVYVLIGVLVFLMKPAAIESWLFFLTTCFTGMRVSFAAPSDLIQPTSFYELRFLNETLLPASLIHLAMRFPRTRGFVERWPKLGPAPYLLSLIFFGTLELTSSAYWNIPRPLFLAAQLYTLVGILFFLTTMMWNFLRDSSVIVRLQSQVIFAGILLAFLIPTTDLISRALWQFHLFPDPALSFGAFLALFPLSIGYTIVKHDLFAIDVIVRRTYGYVLSTGTVVAAYAGIVSLLNVTFRGFDAARSPLFSVGFALGVVLLFEPTHKRIQRLVDRTFYRQQYDYRATIKSLSEAMTSILDPDIIRKTLADAVVKEMFLENGILMARKPATKAYEVAVIDGVQVQALPATIADDDALARLIEDKRTHLLRTDVEMNPAFAEERGALLKTFNSLASELVLPLIYKDEIRGLLSLGRKKSGKLFTPEDLDLLKTVLNQSAIALENAYLFNENLQKGRMEEELKIAHDIQMGMLPDKPPAAKGLQLAARTVPAREVGGDFYDFVEFPGSGGQLGIIIADVSGKGVSAGLLMAGARSTYRVLLDGRPSVQDVMILANQRLKRDIRKGMFIALLYAMFEKDGRSLTLANAGQTQPILIQPGGEPAFIETDGDTFPLGIVEDSDYRASTLTLTDGSVVVFYTDGVVEAMNASGELFGFDRLLDSVREGRELAASSLLDKLFADVTRFAAGAEQHDDITIIVARAA
jgi:sigma-B regulation protein RsbU (phosphoserine phosphatase)